MGENNVPNSKYWGDQTQKRLTDKIENYITNLNKFDTSKRAEHSTLI